MSWLWVLFAAPLVVVLVAILFSAPVTARRGRGHLSEGVDGTGDRLWYAPWIPLGWARPRTRSDERMARNSHERIKSQRRRRHRKGHP